MLGIVWLTFIYLAEQLQTDLKCIEIKTLETIPGLHHLYMIFAILIQQESEMNTNRTINSYNNERMNAWNSKV